MKNFSKAVACGEALEDLEADLALEDEAAGAVVIVEVTTPVGEAANGEVNSGEAVIEEDLVQVHEVAVLAEEGVENEVGEDSAAGVVTAPIEGHPLGADTEEHLGAEATGAAAVQLVEHMARAEAE